MRRNFPQVRSDAAALPVVFAAPALRAGRLAIEALGRSVAEGRIASVHRRAVNVLLGSGKLVALLPAGCPLHPWAVTARFDSWGLAAGAPVHVRGRRLVFENRGTGHRLEVTWDGLRGADLRLNHRPARLAPDLGRNLLELAPAPAPQDWFAAVLLPVLAAFQERGDVSGLPRLVGLGEGLTPSGDDVITGILAGLDLAGAASTEAAALRRAVLEMLPAPLTSRTTLLSAQMIEAARDGCYAEPVLGVLEALAGPPAASLRPAAARLAAVGGRSGRDTLLGIATALLAVQGRVGQEK